MLRRYVAMKVEHARICINSLLGLGYFHFLRFRGIGPHRTENRSNLSSNSVRQRMPRVRVLALLGFTGDGFALAPWP